MKHFLIGNDGLCEIEIKPSDRYGHAFWQIVDHEFYIDSNQIMPCPQVKVDVSKDNDICFHHFKESKNEPDFAALLEDFKQDNLVLYRGFPGCHFCWPGLRSGELKSEGNDDVPTFTMGGSKSAWLPAADQDTAKLVSVQMTDENTRNLFNETGSAIPIGFTVEISVSPGRSNGGRGTALPICWLNSGEIQVKGPLEVYSGYIMKSIAWLTIDAHIVYTDWPKAIPSVFLPPKRPCSFDAEHEFEHYLDWWNSNEFQVWYQAVRENI